MNLCKKYKLHFKFTAKKSDLLKYTYNKHTK